jgi:hypothetical protein
MGQSLQQSRSLVALRDDCQALSSFHEIARVAMLNPEENILRTYLWQCMTSTVHVQSVHLRKQAQHQLATAVGSDLLGATAELDGCEIPRTPIPCRAFRAENHRANVDLVETLRDPICG